MVSCARSMVPAPDKIVGGKYRLERPLAKGGMGSVWVGRHTELDVPVAVKFMAPEIAGTPVARTRFKREAKAAAQLRGPHVVSILDYGVEDGSPYMVMELLDGEDLGALLQRTPRLPIARVAAIVGQVAKALAMAHAAGIVHRDLKPSNLFLARSGEDEIVKVLDFGVAKEMESRHAGEKAKATSGVKTTSGVLIGSPMYMSPEQARGESIDFRSDLWALGVVAYQALVGRPPFANEHLGALLVSIHEGNVEAPTSVAPGLPPALDAYMARALARQPEGRFASAKEMADELAGIARDAKVGGEASISGVSSIAPEAAGRAAADREEAGAPPRTGVPGRAGDTLSLNEGAKLAATEEAPPAAKQAKTRAANEATNEAPPSPATMDARGGSPGGAGGARRKVYVAGGLAAALIGAIAAGWIGLGGDDTSTPVDAAASGSTASSAGALVAPATSGSTASSGGAIVTPAPEVPGDPGIAGDPMSNGATAGSASSTSMGLDAGSSAGNPRGGTTGGPPAPAGTVPKPLVSQAGSAGTAAPVKSGSTAPDAPPRATAVSTVTPAPDPTFGLLPSKKP